MGFRRGTDAGDDERASRRGADRAAARGDFRGDSTLSTLSALLASGTKNSDGRRAGVPIAAGVREAEQARRRARRREPARGSPVRSMDGKAARRGASQESLVAQQVRDCCASLVDGEVVPLRHHAPAGASGGTGAEAGCARYRLMQAAASGGAEP